MFLRNFISKYNLPSNVMKNTRNFSKWYFLPISSNENLKPRSNSGMILLNNELINKTYSISMGEEAQ